MTTISSLKRFGKLSIFVGGLIFAAQNSSAFCLWNCSAKKSSNASNLMPLDTVQSTLGTLNPDEILRTLNKEMVESFALIEKHLSNNENGKAYELATSLLRKVQYKSGFEFKSNAEKSLYISTALRDEYKMDILFASRVYAHFGNLNYNKQQRIIKEISNYQQGLFLEMINLTKRIAVFKARAALALFLAEGPIQAADRKKILTDLALAAVSLIKVKDSSGNVMWIPSKYIIDADYTYMFDREIDLFVVRNPLAGISSADFNMKKNSIAVNAGNYEYEYCKTVFSDILFRYKPDHRRIVAKVCKYVVEEEPLVAMSFETVAWSSCVFRDIQDKGSDRIELERMEKEFYDSVTTCSK